MNINENIENEKETIKTQWGAITKQVAKRATIPRPRAINKSVTLADTANKPRQWKSMLTHQELFNLLYMQPLIVSHTTEFVICISIYIRLHAVTILPPPRSLVPRLGLGNTWIRQLRSGSCHYPSAATKCNVSRHCKPTPSVEKHLTSKCFEKNSSRRAFFFKAK